MRIENNQIYFGNESAARLVERFGSPLYVYEYDILIRQYEQLKSAFNESNPAIFYACKANSNIEILKILNGLGAGIDAVSPGEIFLALRAGFEPDQILLTGTNLTRDDIIFAVENNVIVNIDNVSMLEENGDLFTGRDVSIRLNPDIHSGGHAYLDTGHSESKFGILQKDFSKVIELLTRHNANIVGLHQHIGSEITEADSLLDSMDKLLEATLANESIRFIDIGGGYKVKYYEDDTETDIYDLGARISERFNDFCKTNGRKLRLIIEPGKFLVSESGCLLATVQSIKRNDVKVIVGTDTGMNHLIRPALYQAYHEILNASNVSGDNIEKIEIVGNMCESADVLGKDRLITFPKIGDVLCILNTGSYGYSMASMYNARMLPAEVLIQNGQPRLIRRRQSFDDLLFLNSD